MIAAMMGVMVGLFAQGAAAQDRAWVQLEAFSELVNAQGARGTYAQVVEDVNGCRPRLSLCLPRLTVPRAWRGRGGQAVREGGFSEHVISCAERARTRAQKNQFFFYV
jgi:hypothetical protein